MNCHHTVDPRRANFDQKLVTVAQVLDTLELHIGNAVITVNNGFGCLTSRNGKPIAAASRSPVGDEDEAVQ